MGVILVVAARAKAVSYTHLDVYKRQRQAKDRLDIARVGSHQNDIGRFHRHIRSCADGNAEIGLDQRRGVVDPIPCLLYTSRCV